MFPALKSGFNYRTVNLRRNHPDERLGLYIAQLKGAVSVWDFDHESMASRHLKKYEEIAAVNQTHVADAIDAAAMITVFLHDDNVVSLTVAAPETREAWEAIVASAKDIGPIYPVCSNLEHLTLDPYSAATFSVLQNIYSVSPPASLKGSDQRGNEMMRQLLHIMACLQLTKESLEVEATESAQGSQKIQNPTQPSSSEYGSTKRPIDSDSSIPTKKSKLTNGADVEMMETATTDLVKQEFPEE